jgi:hypothetical protein
VRREHDELVAAEPADDVHRAERRAQRGGHLDERRVAGVVSVGVVDDLEIVEVHVQQHARRRLGPRGGQPLARGGEEAAAVVEPRQLVAQRPGAEQFLLRLALGGVAHDAHDPARGSWVSVSSCGKRVPSARRPDGLAVPVAPTAQRRAATTRQPRPPPRRVERRPLAAEERGRGVGVAVDERLRGVGGLEAAVRVGDAHAVGGDGDGPSRGAGARAPRRGRAVTARAMATSS